MKTGFEYLFKEFGAESCLKMAIKKRGFWPKGGGSIELDVMWVKGLGSIDLVDEGKIKKVRGVI